jgi:hypothetical protein
VPAIVDVGSSAVPQRRLRRGKVEASVGGIEIEIDGVPCGSAAARTQRLEDGAACVESRRVIGPTGAVRVMVATKPVDFRKGAEGLAALVRDKKRQHPARYGQNGRVIALGRKSWLFCGSDRGGERAAADFRSMGRKRVQTMGYFQNRSA